MPIGGGVLALQTIGAYSRRSNSLSLVPEDVIAYNEAQRYFRENLKCTIGLYQGVVTPHMGKLTGVLVVEAKREVAHDGIFIILKGQSLSKRKKDQYKQEKGQAKKPVRALKFNVLGYLKEEGEEEGVYTIEPGSESYPLTLDLPKCTEDLPPPQITSEGKLRYRVQVFMHSGKKCVSVAETSIQFQGYYNLLANPQESTAPIRIDFHLQYKPSFLSRRKVVDVSVSSKSTGYLPQESIDFLLIAKNPEKLALEFKVELVLKAWYQSRTSTGGLAQRRVAVNITPEMLVTSVVAAERVEDKAEIERKVVWKGQLQIPGNLTPTYKFDFFNSISYILRATVKVQGEKEVKASGEAPVYIGTTRERISEEESDDDEEVDYSLSDGGSEVDSHSGAETPLVKGSSAMPPSRSMASLYRGPPSPNVPPRARARAGSFSSVNSYHSYASGGSSFFRLPPSYSQLSSRRPTQDTLPPAYCELALQEQPSQEEAATSDRNSSRD